MYSDKERLQLYNALNNNDFKINTDEFYMPLGILVILVGLIFYNSFKNSTYTCNNFLGNIYLYVFTSLILFHILTLYFVKNKSIKYIRGIDSNIDFIFQKFNWPVKGVVSGVFGSQRILNGIPKRPHYGVDIAALKGSPVLAPIKSIVRMAEEDLYYTGGTIMLDHGHGVTSVYSHLSAINVKVGDTVSRGQKMGEVGSTGRSTGPHLDWRVNWFYERLDPALLVD